MTLRAPLFLKEAVEEMWSFTSTAGVSQVTFLSSSTGSGIASQSSSHRKSLEILGSWRYSVQNHRITEQFGLEGTLEGHLVEGPAGSRDTFRWSSWSEPWPTWPWILWATCSGVLPASSQKTSSLHLVWIYPLNLKSVLLVLSQQALLRSLSSSFW